jgi:hypothetical protein
LPRVLHDWNLCVQYIIGGLPSLSFSEYCYGCCADGHEVAVAIATYDVFVSYSRLDWRHAAEIDSILRAKGLRSFFDRRNLAPGLPWVRALEQAIGAAKAAIVLIGPHGFGNTQQYERDLALYRQSREPTFPVVPVILPDATTDRPFNFLQFSPGSTFLMLRKCPMRRSSLSAC